MKRVSQDSIERAKKRMSLVRNRIYYKRVATFPMDTSKQDVPTVVISVDKDEYLIPEVQQYPANIPTIQIFDEKTINQLLAFGLEYQNNFRTVVELADHYNVGISLFDDEIHRNVPSRRTTSADLEFGDIVYAIYDTTWRTHFDDITHPFQLFHHDQYFCLYDVCKAQMLEDPSQQFVLLTNVNTENQLNYFRSHDAVASSDDFNYNKRQFLPPKSLLYRATDDKFIVHFHKLISYERDFDSVIRSLD